MNLLNVCFYFILCFYFKIEAQQETFNPNPSVYLSDEVWQNVQDYLLPDEHPLKEKLDKIFSRSRALANQESMIAAGFTATQPEKHTGIVVTQHPELKGYVIKAYLDEAGYLKGRPEHFYWIRRVKGSRLVQETITVNHYDHLFKVPKKWIYLLPDEPSPPPQYLRKIFILVEDDMDIFKSKKNERLWKSSYVTQELLQGLYKITTAISLSDSTKPDNCPFSKDGKVAFVDTQTFNTGYVKYDKLTPYLSAPMQMYWRDLTEGLFPSP